MGLNITMTSYMKIIYNVKVEDSMTIFVNIITYIYISKAMDFLMLINIDRNDNFGDLKKLEPSFDSS